MGLHGPKPIPFESFYRLEDRGYETLCWIWIGFIHPSQGYGMCDRFKLIMNEQYSHRIAWRLKHKRRIPKNKQMHHKCAEGLSIKKAFFQRRCCNPDHLRVTTAAINNKLCRENRGRGLIGNLNSAKLTEKDIPKIRRKYASGKYTQTELGKKFGISSYQISSIVTRKTWKRVV